MKPPLESRALNMLREDRSSLRILFSEVVEGELKIGRNAAKDDAGGLQATQGFDGNPIGGKEIGEIQNNRRRGLSAGPKEFGDVHLLQIACDKDMAAAGIWFQFNPADHTPPQGKTGATVSLA
jgi:hypothetical protein